VGNLPAYLTALSLLIHDLDIPTIRGRLPSTAKELEITQSDWPSDVSLRALAIFNCLASTIAIALSKRNIFPALVGDPLHAPLCEQDAASQIAVRDAIQVLAFSSATWKYSTAKFSQYRPVGTASRSINSDFHSSPKRCGSSLSFPM
jgi:hypothetical protein